MHQVRGEGWRMQLLGADLAPLSGLLEEQEVDEGRYRSSGNSGGGVSLRSL